MIERLRPWKELDTSYCQHLICVSSYQIGIGTMRFGLGLEKDEELSWYGEDFGANEGETRSCVGQWI